MNYLVLLIFSIANFCVCTILVGITYFFLQKYDELGVQKVTFSLDIQKINRRALFPTYLMQIEYNGEKIKQNISRSDYYRLKNQKETYVNIRKYRNEYSNPNAVKYEFSLSENINWKEKDKKACIRSYIYFLLLFELVGIMCIFQL